MKRSQSQIEEELITEEPNLLEEIKKQPTRKRLDSMTDLEKVYLPEIIQTLQDR